MLDRVKELTQLCSIGAPSGYEFPVVEHLLKSQPEGCAQQYVDGMGNLIRLFPCGREKAPLLLIDAHLDEIGFIITGYEDGFLRFQTVGGVDPRMLPAREVRLLTEPPLVGVITSGLEGEESTAFTKDQLRLDVGLSQKEAEERVPIGTRGVYHEGGFPLGETRFCAKATDDRACYLQLLRAMELAPAQQRVVDVALVGSVKEETGGDGAATATYHLNPDYCIAVDVTHGTTLDGPKSGTFQLGKGPAIGVGPNMARWMTKLMEDCAKKEGIPYGLEVMSGSTGTNGWEMQVCREGIPTGILSLPQRYMHTPVEVFDWADFENGAKLLAFVICALGREEQVC
jgi:endoglucanase